MLWQSDAGDVAGPAEVAHAGASIVACGELEAIREAVTIAD